MGTIYPRSDHYSPLPELSNGNFYFAVGEIFGHQRVENEARNTKMYRGQETHPISINARYEMNWANIFCKKLRKPHFRPNILLIGKKWPERFHKKFWLRCVMSTSGRGGIFIARTNGAKINVSHAAHLRHNRRCINTGQPTAFAVARSS